MFKIGDKVTIRKDLAKRPGSSAIFVMYQYAGRQAIIKNIYSFTPNHYFLDIDNELYIWSEDCFEKEEKEFTKVVAEKVNKQINVKDLKEVEGNIYVLVIANRIYLLHRCNNIYKWKRFNLTDWWSKHFSFEEAIKKVLNMGGEVFVLKTEEEFKDFLEYYLEQKELKIKN